MGTLSDKMRCLLPWVACATVAVLATGCGVRGALEKLPEERNSSTATAESGQGKPANTAPKPHEGFILDGLIR